MSRNYGCMLLIFAMLGGTASADQTAETGIRQRAEQAAAVAGGASAEGANKTRSPSTTGRRQRWGCTSDSGPGTGGVSST